MGVDILGSSALATMCVLNEERRSALGDVETRDKLKEGARVVRAGLIRDDNRVLGGEEGVRERGESVQERGWTLESRGV